MKGSFLFLGTGASNGVPLIGCECDVCRSPSPFNKRLRSSGLIKLGEKRFLIDVGPDFRQQALLHKIYRLDGLLLTHTHFDHIAGIDELRIYNYRMKRPLPCLLSKPCLKILKERYSYLFREGEEKSMKAKFEFRPIEHDFGAIEFEGVKIETLSYFQSRMLVTGYRFGDFAYVSDIREYDPAIFTALKGIKKLVLSALRKEPSHVHFSVDEAVEFARQVGAEKTYLTHMAHFLEHEEIERILPPDIRMGFDGLEIDFQF